MPYLEAICEALGVHVSVADRRAAHAAAASTGKRPTIPRALIDAGSEKVPDGREVETYALDATMLARALDDSASAIARAVATEPPPPLPAAGRSSTTGAL